MVVAGCDEVGRGPLAGDVVAAAVILGDYIPQGLADSKKLSEKKGSVCSPKSKVTQWPSPLVARALMKSMSSIF